MVRKTFWMVLGAGTPTYRHPTIESAKTEAERLARLEPGMPFTVLEAVATVVKDDIHWDDHHPDSEVPF